MQVVEVCCGRKQAPAIRLFQIWLTWISFGSFIRAVDRTSNCLALLTIVDLHLVVAGAKLRAWYSLDMAASSGADSAATFAIEDEDSTLANALTFMLNKK